MKGHTRTIKQQNLAGSSSPITSSSSSCGGHWQPASCNLTHHSHLPKYQCHDHCGLAGDTSHSSSIEFQSLTAQQSRTVPELVAWPLPAVTRACRRGSASCLYVTRKIDGNQRNYRWRQSLGRRGRVSRTWIQVLRFISRHVLVILSYLVISTTSSRIPIWR